MQETTYLIPGVPDLAVLADFHSSDPEPILQSLRNHRPQFILVPGDFIYGTVPQRGLKMQQSTQALRLLSGCYMIAQTFVSLGNHEWMLHQLDLQEIKSTGAIVLDNSWVTYSGIHFGGLTSAHATAYQQFRGRGQIYPAEPKYGKIAPSTDWLKDYARQKGLHILLCHQPEYYHLIPRSVELIVSGHAHGGQWRFFNPFTRKWAGVFAPGQGFLPRWTEGIRDGKMVISRGLANTSRFPRLNNPPEIVYISGSVQT